MQHQELAPTLQAYLRKRRYKGGVSTAIDRPFDPPGRRFDARAAVRRMVRGDERDAAWVRPTLLGVTVLAAVLYLVNLTVSGYANTYYVAAAEAASKSWSAMFFGSLDSANAITIDKPPLATALMGLSVRVFGLSSWSILLPQALAGVATVLILFQTVRRSFGPAAAAIAAVVMALTPVAVLIFRYDNPDALLTLLLVAAAWALVRGLDDGRLRWPMLAAALVGAAFLTKYLQAYLVLPAFAAVWLLAAPGSLRRRLGGALASLAVVLATSFWWVAIVELIPTTARPYIGGSTTDSALELLFGYDGLGRIFGGAGPAAGAPPGGAAVPGFGGPGGPGGSLFGGEAGILRLFNDAFGGQVGWLIPIALLATAAGLWLRRRAARTDPARAGLVLWGLWFAVTAGVFSLMSGIVHPYYGVVLAPAIGALVGGGVVLLFEHRSRARWPAIVLGAGFVITAALGWLLLERTPDFVPGLGIAAVVVAGLAAFALISPSAPGSRIPAIAIVLGLGAMLFGPIAYSVDTMGTAYAGGDPLAGPAGRSSGPGGIGPDAGPSGGSLPGVGPGGGSMPGVGPGAGSMPGVGPGAGSMPGVGPGAGSMPGVGPGGGFGTDSGAGDLAVDQALVDYLVTEQGAATWLTAVGSWQTAAALQAATGQPVMSMGGFGGSDPFPTLAELQAYVRSGELRFVMTGGRAGPGIGAGDRDAWVAEACTAVDLGSTEAALDGPMGPFGAATLYDCAGAAG